MMHGSGFIVLCMLLLCVASAALADGLPIPHLAAQARARFGALDDLLILNGGAITTKQQWEQRRAQIRRTLLTYLGDFPATKVPLNPRVVKEEKLDGYTRRKVLYATEEGEDVPAYLLIPASTPPFPPFERGGGRFPAIVAMHQTVAQGKDEPCGIGGNPNLHCGLELVKRGYVVLAPDSITAGERVYAGYKPYETEAFDKAHPHWSAMGKMIWDHQRGVDYLETLPFVDKDRIGAIGHSLGAYNAFFLAAFDERLKAVVESCGYTTIASDEGRERWARKSWFVHIPKLRPFVEPGGNKKPPFDFHEVLALLAPRPLFQNVGLQDTIFPSCITVAQVHRELEKVYRLLGAEGRVETYAFDGPHDFPQEARERAYTFLDRCLS